MLRFSLDRALPSCGEVLPVLSLPARVRPTTSTSTTSTIDTTSTGMSTTVLKSVEENTNNSIYEEVQRLCIDVHATCVREIVVSLPGGGHNVHHHPTTTHTTEVVHATTESDIAAVIIASPIPNPVSSTMSSFNVYALESPGYLGIAGKVWDSMYVLLQYLSQHTARLVRGKRIVELGCGTGLAGMFYLLCEFIHALSALTIMLLCVYRHFFVCVRALERHSH